MTRETVGQKARRLLVAGRLVVREVVPGGRVVATVDGDTGRYDVGFAGGEWSCTCPARTPCSHIAALRLVVVQPPRPDS